MAESSDQTRFLALLIDGDNAQAALIGQVLTETAKYGIVTTRRIYGDWTTPEMSKWKETLNAHAVQPVQQFRYTTGKNATDSTLIIEAMDLLHSGTVNGFCIVSSDSDYTRLATRIREQGLFVMGIGQATTPKSLVNACEVFVYTKNLIPPEKPEARVQRAAAGGGAPDDEERPATETGGGDWVQTIAQAMEMGAQEDGWAFLGTVGQRARQLDPAFDSRTFGYKQLSLLINSRPDLFETRKPEESAPSLIYVRPAEGVPPKAAKKRRKQKVS